MTALVSLVAVLATLGQTAQPVRLELTTPLGPSPKVFSRGWTFGARATGPNRLDLSKSVQWSGSGAFSPATGARSMPIFSRHGRNIITFSVLHAGKRYSKSFTVQTVNPDDYARVGTLAQCPSDAHGCPACPHTVSGVVETGSRDVLIEGKPTARKGDTGHHTTCCGPNTFTILDGDPNVLIHGIPVAKIGSRTRHCGGDGALKEGSTTHTNLAPNKGWVLRGPVRFEPPPRNDYDHMGFKFTVSPGSAQASWFRPDQPSIRTALSMTWSAPPASLEPGKAFTVTFHPADAGSTAGAGGFLGADAAIFFAERDGAEWRFLRQARPIYAALGEPMKAQEVSFTPPAGKKGNLLAFQVVVGTSLVGGIGHNYVYEYRD